MTTVQIGLANNDQGVHLVVIQRHADGSTTSLHAERVPEGDSVLRFTPAPLWRFTCKGKGGEYELLGLAKGAGKSKLVTDLQVYRDVATGHLYFRDPEDFDNRMERIA